MPNGKPGDNPVTDMLNHGMHPFPADIEAMLRELLAIDNTLIKELAWEPFSWEKGEELDRGRETLRRLLAKHRK